jgi:hypothetical protein
VEQKIRRKFKTFPITIATSTSNATTIRWDDVAGGCIELGAGATAATSLQVWASESGNGTFGRLYDASGNAADITLSQSATQSRVYPIPDPAYGAGAIKIVAGQAAATAVTALVMLKT